MSVWNGLPPDPTIEGWHWIQPRSGRALFVARFLPQRGQFPATWEMIGSDRGRTPSGLQKDGWLYVAPVEHPAYRWALAEKAA